MRPASQRRTASPRSTLPELRKDLAEVMELMAFGAGRPNGPGARFHVGTLRREIPFIPKTTAGTWLGPVVGADVPGGPPPARDVRQSDLERGVGRARGTRAPTNVGVLMRQGQRGGGLGGYPAPTGG